MRTSVRTAISTSEDSDTASPGDVSFPRIMKRNLSVVYVLRPGQVGTGLSAAGDGGEQQQFVAVGQLAIRMIGQRADVPAGNADQTA